MIMFLMKLLSSVRKAIAGRKHPHQLAWGIAFGLLLGVVPHGNLLAVVILLLILSLKINHAMAGLTAIGVSFAATRLDPYSHHVGDFILSHPDAQQYAARIWQWPLMPWTDLNNTVVLGSFLIGVVALFPSFIVTYPICRLLAPREDDHDPPHDPAAASSAQRTAIDSDSQRVVVVDQGHQQIARPHRPVPQTTPHPQTASPSVETPDFQELHTDEAVDPTAPDEVAVETRIDVIRLKDTRAIDTAQETNSKNASDAAHATDDQPMDEALKYLLRQLRDSQARKTA